MRRLGRGFVIVIVQVFFISTLQASIGLMVGYDVRETNGDACTVWPQAAQLPLYENYHPYTPDRRWWNATLEEATFANVDYVALNVRGETRIECGNAIELACPPDLCPNAGPNHVGGEPGSWASMAVQALNERGYAGILKLALFDDSGSYIYQLKACDSSATAFDFANPAIVDRYIWEDRWKPYFENVPPENRMTIGVDEFGRPRPLIFIWTVIDDLSFPFLTPPGSLRDAIRRLRDHCRTTFDFDPFIVTDISWLESDPLVGTELDGVNEWFAREEANPAYTTYTHDGYSGLFTTGVAVPGFKLPEYEISRQNGQTLRDALTGMNGVDLILLEGQTDIAENAGFYRGASGAYCAVPGVGEAWTHPNQYLNIVREFTTPDPRYVVFEAEAADDHANSASPSPSLEYRRYTPGSPRLDIHMAGADWSAHLRPGEWVEFQNLRMGGSSTYVTELRYSAVAPATAAILIDGSIATQFTVAATGSFETYRLLRIPQQYGVPTGPRTVRFRLDAGEIRLDDWALNALSGPCSTMIDPTSRLVPAAESTGTVAVTIGAGCTWSAAAVDPYVSIIGPASGTGTGTVTFRVASNPGPARTVVFTVAGETISLQQAAGLPVGDVDGNQRADLIWHRSDGSARVWYLDAASVVGTATLPSAAATLVPQGVADFDGDQRPDILWRDDNTGAVVLWLMNGTSLISSTTVAVPAQEWTIVATADLDRDGQADVVLYNSNTGAVVAWLMDGPTIRASGTLAVPPAGWQVIGAGDLDANGTADLLLRHSTTHDVVVWFLDGLSITTTATIATPNANWGLQAVADFDGNGTADLLWRNTATNETVVWVMFAARIAATGYVATPPAEWEVQATVDVNGDRKRDLFWRNTQNGLNAIWIMSGTSVTASYVTSEPDLAWSVAGPRQ